MQITIKDSHKSIKGDNTFELPDFSVLTGKNGSGKTHLLEALADINNSEITYDGKIVKNVRYIEFNSLNPNIIEECDPSSITQFIKHAWREFINSKTYVANPIQDIYLERMLSRISDQNLKRFIQKTFVLSKKPLNELTEDDFADNFETSFMNQNDLLTAQFALIFKNYHKKQEENDLNEYYNSKGREITKPVLSKEEFIKKHGIPPWEFINKILKETDIPYKVNDPVGSRIDSNFIFKLKDINEGFEINSKDLSTGEKVLMSLALAIYNTNGDFGKPELLLIDEPDAALHPSMSRKMVNILLKNIVEDNGIPTVITTHSPTTVIAADGVSIYQIERGRSIPMKISTQDAVSLLSSDIPFLKISNEKRRQVFVESKYDVQYYEKIANILARLESLTAEPIFIPARTSNGSNCADVIAIVNNLFDSGNDQVYGIIDWDLTNKSKDRIIVLGENRRYSIENYLLDPLKMGLLFIRERKVNVSDFSNLSFTTYSEVHNLTAEDAQTIINKVLEDLKLNSLNILKYKLYNGWELSISKEFNELQGHVLETLYKKTYPFLQSYHQENHLKLDIIDKVMDDHPQYTPNDLFEILKMIK